MNDPGGMCPGGGITAGGGKLAVGSVHDPFVCVGDDGWTTWAPAGRTSGTFTTAAPVAGGEVHAATGRAIPARTTPVTQRRRRGCVVVNSGCTALTGTRRSGVGRR